MRWAEKEEIAVLGLIALNEPPELDPNLKLQWNITCYKDHRGLSWSDQCKGVLLDY